MHKNKGFFALLLLLSTLGVLVGVAKERIPSSQQVRLSVKALEQASNKRNFLTGSYTESWSHSGAENFELFGSLRAKLDHRGHVYVMDYGDFRIKELGADGHPVRIYGAGKGQGPEEFLSLSDIEILQNGEVWVSDPGTGRVIIFDSKGQLIRTLRVQPLTHRLALAPGGGFFSNLTLGSEKLLGRYDAEGIIQEKFGSLLESQANHSMALNGWIESDGRLGLVYAGGLSTILAAYNPDASQRFLVRTIEPFSLPKIRQDSEKKWIDSDSRRAAIALSVNDDEIHVLTYFVEGVRRRGVIDTYRWSDGTYLYSRRVPGKSTWLTVGDGYVVTTHHSTVTKWQWKRTAPRV